MSTDYLRERFSFSKLSTFSKCPRKFWYRYVLRRKEAAFFQLYGRAVHFGMETDNRAKLEGRRLPLPAVLDAAVDRLKLEGQKENVRVDVDPFVKEHGAQLEAFEDRGYRAAIRPVPGTVESMFDAKVTVGNPETGEVEGKAVIEGFVDVVSENPTTGEKTVIDYKTGAKPMYQGEAENSLQLGLYEIGAQAGGTQVVSFVKGGKQKPTARMTGRVQLNEARRTKLLTWIADTIKGILRGIKTGDFPKCEPSCHWCSKNACDFYGLCFPEKDPDLPKLIQISEIRPAGTVDVPDWRK